MRMLRRNQCPFKSCAPIEAVEEIRSMIIDIKDQQKYLINWQQSGDRNMPSSKFAPIKEATSSYT